MGYDDNDPAVLAALTLLALKLRRRAEALDERARVEARTLREVAGAIESILLVMSAPPAPVPITTAAPVSTAPSIELAVEQETSEQEVPAREAPALIESRSPVRCSDPMDLLRLGRAQWGNPCIYGHQSENGKNLRYTKGGICVQCQRDRRAKKECATDASAPEPMSGVLNGASEILSTGGLMNVYLPLAPSLDLAGDAP